MISLNKVLHFSIIKAALIVLICTWGLAGSHIIRSHIAMKTKTDIVVNSKNTASWCLVHIYVSRSSLRAVLRKLISLSQYSHHGNPKPVCTWAAARPADGKYSTQTGLMRFRVFASSWIQDFDPKTGRRHWSDWEPPRASSDQGVASKHLAQLANIPI